MVWKAAYCQNWGILFFEKPCDILRAYSRSKLSLALCRGEDVEEWCYIDFIFQQGLQLNWSWLLRFVCLFFDASHRSHNQH